MKSIHERHRIALTALSEDAHLPVVTRAAQALGISPDHSPVALRSGLTSGPGPYAELVVALGHRPQDAVSVECWVSRPDTTEAPYVARAGRVGWVAVAPLTDDPVAATAAGLGGREVTLLRYHAGSRATVRVVAPIDLPRIGAAYAKVFSDHRGAARQVLAEQLHTATTDGGLALRLPRPAGYDAARFVLWQHEVTGVPATLLLTGPASPALGARLGAALAGLHGSGLDPSRRLTAAGLLVRAERYAAEASRLVPGLGGRIMRLLDSVGADSVLEGGRQVPVHGSPDPAQWLVDGDADPGLLDFDRFAWAAPEHDLACFLVEVEALGRGLYSAAVTERFLAGYEAASGPVDPAALRRHCTLRRLGKVVRAARSLRVDGDVRTGRVLAAAERAAAQPLTSSSGGRS